MRPLQSDLDSYFIEGKLTEEEYLHLAIEDVNVLAVAEDKVDGITTVCLVKEASGFMAEVIYPLENSDLDEKFIAHESSLKVACDNFITKIKALECRGHDFDVTWYIKKK